MTNCDQVKRKICAEDHCRVVEGEEECHDKVIASTLEVPEETCALAPKIECKNVTTSVPQLMPQQECRKIPKEVCQTVFLNPQRVKVGRLWWMTWCNRGSPGGRPGQVLHNRADRGRSNAGQVGGHMLALLLQGCTHPQEPTTGAGQGCRVEQAATEEEGKAQC